MHWASQEITDYTSKLDNRERGLENHPTEQGKLGDHDSAKFHTERR